LISSGTCGGRRSLRQIEPCRGPDTRWCRAASRPRSGWACVALQRPRHGRRVCRLHQPTQKLTPRRNLSARRSVSFPSARNSPVLPQRFSSIARWWPILSLGQRRSASIRLSARLLPFSAAGASAGGCPLVVVERLETFGKAVRHLNVVCHDPPPSARADGLLCLNFLSRFGRPF
jgi:hypothetical protein